MYGHKGDECPSLEAKAAESKPPTKQDRPEAMEEGNAKSSYGPWMLPSYVYCRQEIKTKFHDRQQQRNKERDGIRVDLDPLPSGGPNGEQVGSQFRSNWARKDIEALPYRYLKCFKILMKSWINWCTWPKSNRKFKLYKAQVHPGWA